MAWVIRMTNKAVTAGYIVAMYDDRDKAIQSLKDIHNRYSEYLHSPIVDARSIFRYSDESTKFILNWE